MLEQICGADKDRLLFAQSRLGQHGCRNQEFANTFLALQYQWHAAVTQWILLLLTCSLKAHKFVVAHSPGEAK